MNKVAAKAKVRKHLKTKGDEYCLVTERLIMFWWRILNTLVFDSKLRPPAKIELRNFHDNVLGWCKPYGRWTNGDVVCGMRREYTSRTVLLTVLVHEMVHQNQWHTHRQMSHGRTFTYWRNRVKRTTGLPLSEFVDVDC